MNYNETTICMAEVFAVLFSLFLPLALLVFSPIQAIHKTERKHLIEYYTSGFE